MPYQMIVLKTGYVESSSLALVVFIGDARFTDDKETVLTAFATALWLKWCEDELYCLKWSGPKPETGERQIDWTRFNPSRFEDWIFKLPTSTADSFGGAEIGHWWPWHDWTTIVSIPRDETIVIYEKTETLLPLHVALSIWPDIPDENSDFSKAFKLYRATLVEKRSEEDLTKFRQDLAKEVVDRR